jgi:hypothetical protein
MFRALRWHFLPPDPMQEHGLPPRTTDTLESEIHALNGYVGKHQQEDVKPF